MQESALKENQSKKINSEKNAEKMNEIVPENAANYSPRSLSTDSIEDGEFKPSELIANALGIDANAINEIIGKVEVIDPSKDPRGFNYELIRRVQKHPALFDTTNSGYKLIEVRNRQWDEIAAEIGQPGKIFPRIILCIFEFFSRICTYAMEDNAGSV